MVRRVLIVVGLVLLVSGGVGIWLWWTAQPSPKGEAYVGLADAPLWDGTGQVRRRLANLPWGEKLTVLDQYNDSIEVRTPQGKIGWINQDRLIDPQVWSRLGALAARVRSMATQAPAHTAVLSNLRLDPGIRSPRVGQLRPDTPVEVLARGVAERSAAKAKASAAPRRQDWLLVRAHADGAEMAGWVLGSFIDLDLPNPLPGYAASTGMNPVAFFTLRTVRDPAEGPKAYYLVAGTNLPQGSPCDFTMLRVYTWSIAKKLYETSFVSNGLCGHMPIRVRRNVDRQHDAIFSFDNFAAGGSRRLSYRLRSTIVHRLHPARAGR